MDDFLKIGGVDMCVEYKYNKRNPNHVELQWLHTSRLKCVEGDMEIQGENTMLLFYLSVEILKTYTPVKNIEFLHNSHFSCKLPNNKDVKIYVNHYYFLFHNGKTWYQEKLGAYPLLEDERIRYESFVKNFDDPDMKPPTFDFKNNDLNQIFLPIWAATKTWKSFLNKIKSMPNICQKIYPWYYIAASLLRNQYAMPDKWCIDIDKLRYKSIHFERIRVGGTKKMKDYVPDTSVCIDYPIPSICRNFKYS